MEVNMRFFKVLLISFLLSSCSEWNQEDDYRSWVDIPKPVQREFMVMLNDTSDSFVHLKCIEKNKKCNYENLYYTSNEFVFSNGEVELTQDIYETTLKFFVFYNDTLYCSIKNSLTGKQGGKSYENIVGLDTLSYKVIWKEK